MKNYTILGTDIGNSTCETNTGVIFDSKITDVEPLSKADTLLIDKKTYWIGEGNYDTTYKKINKENYINFLFGALALSTDTVNNYIVLGLPLSQFKEDKTSLINMVLANREKTVKINDVEKQIIIEDVEVFPEGVVTLPDDYEGICIDIGGRTTDCALVVNERGRRRILNPISHPAGTINLYKDFINKINNNFSLDLTMNDAERIMENGLILDGKETNIDFAMEVYKQFVDSIISQLQVEYSLRTNRISLTGGGAILFYEQIKNRLGEGVTIQDNPIFANANAYYELGCSIWQ
ncbi:ParM/StbA family protein [Clostridium sp.]|uniref:ParM/StbA family protein n=1 Tax=Clostridium sp. TaxID=1506 RepID=UPI00284ADE02|nr:ParM/StbA family protein [Clostridium sp.]MDR3593571.1 ParM/StbA family protein [Clostridium sp.]